MRPSARQPAELRPIRFTRHYTQHAEGAVLVEFGNTKVLCTASVETGVPSFLKGKGEGWVTAEYGMLPRATHTRSRRENTSKNSKPDMSKPAAPKKSSVSLGAACGPWWI